MFRHNSFPRDVARRHRNRGFYLGIGRSPEQSCLRPARGAKHSDKTVIYFLSFAHPLHCFIKIFQRYVLQRRRQRTGVQGPA